MWRACMVSVTGLLLRKEKARRNSSAVNWLEGVPADASRAPGGGWKLRSGLAISIGTLAVPTGGTVPAGAGLPRRPAVRAYRAARAASM
ncbi:hypothetical protein Bpla01_21010 [Burkholderia plantarii]|nr:hypothetical protein Bpla01_21010 [Burkholderia plantarii]